MRRALLHFVLMAVACEAFLVYSDAVGKWGRPSGRAVIFFVVPSVIFAAAQAVSRGRRAREAFAIRYRPTLLQGPFPVFAVMAVVVMPGGAIVGWYRSDPIMVSTAWEMSRGLLAAAPFYLFMFMHGPSVTLTPAALITRRLGRRVIYWREVVDIIVQKELGFGIRVVVRDVRGRWVRLPAPHSFLDRGFDAKVALIRDCWLGQHDWSLPRQRAVRHADR